MDGWMAEARFFFLFLFLKKKKKTKKRNGLQTGPHPLFQLGAFLLQPTSDRFISFVFIHLFNVF